MKVAYVSHCNFPNRFAHSIQIIKNAQSWSVVSDDFTLYTNLDAKKYYQFNQENLNDFYGVKTPFNIIKSPFYFEIDHWFLTKYTKPISSFLRNYYFKKTAKKLKKNNIDFAYTRTIGFPKHAIEHGIPVILESHSPLGSDIDKQEVHPFINHELFLKIVTISEQLKQHMINNGLPESKILVAPDGADLNSYSDNLSKQEARAKLGFPIEGKYALYVGHLYKDRGIQEIMQSAESMPEVQFIIVGGHSADIEFWQKHVEKNSLHNVNIVGFVENRYVPLYQWMADVLLMPYSKSCGTSEWMSPLKLFEYMASGRAIIASYFPVFDDILVHEKNAYLVEADNTESLKNGLNTIFTNEPLMNSISQQAKKDVQNHSWDARAQFIADSINS
jgi:glycosyltransferase involved in cell wall biosynthesis